MQSLDDLVLECMQQGCTDLHISGNHPFVVRKNGNIHYLKELVISPSEVDSLVNELLDPIHKKILSERWSVDLAKTIAGSRLRINVFRSHRGLSLAIRFLPGRIPSVEQLNLLPSLQELTYHRSGLILICGATGSGKSTTIASLLQKINTTKSLHVITLEDPIEFRFQTIRSFFEQRELGVHFQNFEQGLIDILREMPDVVMVGELREPETIRLTLNAAEAGHLVFATLHASTVEEALYRVCNAFPLDVQEYVRHQLSSSLNAVIVQQLHYKTELGFRVPMLSVLRTTKSIKRLIREGKLSQIENALEMGRQEGMYTFDGYKREFLDQKRNFVSPVQILQASKEEYSEEESTSQFGQGGSEKSEDQVKKPQPYTTSVPLKNAGPESEIQGDDQEGLYHLKGDEDLAEVLAQLSEDRGLKTEDR
ncbi:MAG: PilT/PilU family type 4a pilus ATPase [Desulfovermiculus sp.]|nr:PilT/PilU family type 4a pilus ATPase [Desulfovermiculus sp.]